MLTGRADASGQVRAGCVERAGKLTDLLQRPTPILVYDFDEKYKADLYSGEYFLPHLSGVGVLADKVTVRRW